MIHSVTEKVNTKVNKSRLLLTFYFFWRYHIMQRRENGMDTIYQRDNGTWVGLIKEKGKNGKTKYKCISGKSQAEEKEKFVNITNSLMQ